MINELLPGVYVHTSHIQKLQSVVLVDEKAVYVFDPCYFPDEINEIRELARSFETPNREKYLVLTHSDFDHIAGVHEFPEYKVIASSAWDESNEVHSIEKIEQFDSEFYVDREWTGKMPRVPMGDKVNHGQQKGEMTFYHAKGHTWDGLVTIYGQTAIVGDYLSAVEFPFVYTSYRAYMDTLTMFSQIFETHSIDTVITQHGPAALDKTEIQRRIDLSRDYLKRAVELVGEGMERGLSTEKIIEMGADFQYEAQPIAIGILNFHIKNIKLIHQELTQ
ncbi:MBL fold metallo-hydrolase [Paenibacillus sp. GP183]|uniref:MBL fold metallo-hydrolase n=1 Tax=Paenibacillus sp. GP183 TaxID=1882751 RepID=UPI0008971B2A|nr:MBL fold metallo-hydrolase [Paenibacillus sp. GP183]SEC80423.1 Metallo-beta-lactamase superfamily protein [Paenibacillus sp. GP183]